MCDSLLNALDFKTEEKIISIRENKLADATFILASYMSKCITEDKNICLITLHNTFAHYQNIGRRLGYDLSTLVRENKLKLIEPLNEIINDFSTSTGKKYYSVNPEMIAKHLINEINNKCAEFNMNCCVIIDDLSHLLDLGLDVKQVSNFVQHLVVLTSKDVSIVVNCHVASPIDEIVANLVFYSAQMMIVVSALKTGRSKNVSGVLQVIRNGAYDRKTCTYHYKLMEKEIRTFAPGRAII